ncbi:MAG: hypothetical protein II181_01005 [Firmicutes bacterium]|nr:hypothetical protein [Bacillota bacterium]
MAQKQFIKEVFKVIRTDQNNEDGTPRQKLLRKFQLRGEDEATFNRGPIREDNTQLIEVMVNGEKLGELADEDYRRYNAMIRVAKDARVQIYEEEQEDGTITYTADAVLVVPYIVSKESRDDLQGRKRMAIGVMGIVFLATSIWLFVKGDIKFGLLGLAIAAGMAYWGFIRKPSKDDVVLKYIETGKKGRTW